MLNRLFSAAMLAAMGLLCFCCSPRLGENEYILRGTIEGDDLPEKVVLLDITADPSVGDTVGLKGRSFEFRGTVEEPMVTILQYTTQGGKRGLHVFYLEPGDIRMEIEVGSPEARFKGSPINAEAAEWAAMQREPEANVGSLGVEYAKRHPDSWFTLYKVLWDMTYGGNVDEYTQQFYDALTPAAQESKPGRQLLEMLEFNKIAAGIAELTEIGRQAPDFTLPDTAGKPVALSSMRGKWVLLDFWASWCGNCREENPNVVKAYNNLKDSNFTVVAISIDDDNDKGRKAWLRAVEEDGMPWTQLLDGLVIEVAGQTINIYQYYSVKGIPMNFLIDPAGRIVAKNLRGETLTEQIKNYIK